MARLFGRQTKEQEQRDELLSAYLDDQLSAGERARLEAQLKTDPALQVELEALRHTVALVRDLPPVPIPRNFILPQTVMARPRPAPTTRRRRALRAKPQDKAWAAPFLTAATSIASLLFVIVLAGDLLLSRVGGLAFAPASAPLPEAEAPKTELTPPLVGQELGAEETMPTDAISTATPLPMEAPVEAPLETTAEAERGAVVTPQVAASPAPAMGGGGPTEEPAAPAPVPSPAEAEELTVAPTMATAAAVAEEKDEGSAEPTPSVVIETPPSEVEEEEADAAEDRQDVPESAVTEPVTISPWRVLEVALGLTTLGLALATVWAWRARRH